MNILIPLLFIGSIFYMASMYAYVVFMRRTLMLDQVLNFIKKEDTPESMKKFVVMAFKDTLSFSLPLTMCLVRKKCCSLSQVDKNKLEEITKKRTLEWENNKEASRELSKIIDIMFYLNNKISWPFALVAKLITLISSGYEIPDNNVYIDKNLKHQH